MRAAYWWDKIWITPALWPTPQRMVELTNAAYTESDQHPLHFSISTAQIDRLSPLHRRAPFSKLGDLVRSGTRDGAFKDATDAIGGLTAVDGRFTVFGWSQRAKKVHAYRVEALLL
jgi:hypothetical protein